MKVPIVLLLVVTATLSAPSNAQVSQQSPQDATVMERGRYVIEIAAACGICHTTRGADGQLLPNMKLAGGRAIIDRGFRAVVPNITPDPDTGDRPMVRRRDRGCNPRGTPDGRNAHRSGHADRALPWPVGP